MSRTACKPVVLAWALIVGLSATHAQTASQPADPARKRPNVLFIASDDLNLQLGCYGSRTAQTPHLDRLASRGVRFDLTYCQYPLCNPSRVSMLTGVRPNTSRVYDLATNFRTTIPDAVTLPQLFRQNGYYTARVGKIFHYGVPREIGTPGMDDPISWDETTNPLGRDKVEESKIHVLTRGTGNKTIGFAMAWLDMDGTDEEQTDGKSVTKTVQLLEQFAQSGKPFFIGMGFFRPHTPFVATRRWFERHPKDGVLLPVGPTDDLLDIPEIALHIKPPNYGLGESDLRDCLRGYRSSISCLDAQVGHLLETLERLKLAENTIVVFWSDNGYMVGEHGQWQKQMLFDESARVPLIIYAPGAKGNGQACIRPVELLDVYPTLRELCNLPHPPQKLEGTSLVPMLTEPTAPSERAIYTQVTRRIGKGKSARLIMGYTVRTQRWHYTEWGPNGKQGRELYDHEADPQEFKNLVDDPGHAQTIAQLRPMLKRIAETQAPDAVK